MPLFGGYVLWGLTQAAALVALVLLALALSSGLYMMSEMCEEYPTFAGRIVKLSVYVVMALHLVVYLDGIPFYYCFLGAISHFCYLLALHRYPLIQLFSVQTVLVLIAFVASHMVWFDYFITSNHGGYKNRNGDYYDQDYDSINNHNTIQNFEFGQILGFFLVMIWFVPFALFVSLTINDYSLPGQPGSMGASTNYGFDDLVQFFTISNLNATNLYNGIYDSRQTYSYQMGSSSLGGGAAVGKKVPIFRALYDACAALLEKIFGDKFKLGGVRASLDEHREYRQRKSY